MSVNMSIEELLLDMDIMHMWARAMPFSARLHALRGCLRAPPGRLGLRGDRQSSRQLSPCLQQLALRRMHLRLARSHGKEMLRAGLRQIRRRRRQLRLQRGDARLRLLFWQA